MGTISFRSQIKGTIAELIEDEGLECQASQTVLSYFAGVLLDYRDEGVELSPKILFCEKIDSVLEAFPGAIKYEIGTGPISQECARSALKNCAPLTKGNWSVYFERVDKDRVSYGVFSYSRSPTAIPLTEAISLSKENFCILILKVSKSTIKLMGSKGHEINVVFSTQREEASDDKPILEFANAVCRGVPNDHPVSASFRQYISRLIVDVLSHSHGTIFVCVDEKGMDVLPQLKDRVSLVPPLDFFKTFSEYQSSSSAEAILALQSAEDLFEGFVQSDGIVAFSFSGTVVAYRVFYRSENEAKDKSSVVGGARSRAFEGVKALVGSGLVSALFRSQDGLTLFVGDGK